MSSDPCIVSVGSRLMALYAAACAPLSSETLINEFPDMEPSDFTAAIAIDEIKFLKSLADTGLSTLVEALDCLPVDIVQDQEHPLINHSPEVSVALLSAASFASRLSFVATQINHACMHAADRISADPTKLMKDLEQRAKDGERPLGESGKRLAGILDFTPNARWTSMEVPLKNRVGFKETTAVISEGKVEVEALKVSDVRRKKQRYPTGYHKFTFKDLGLEDSDVEGESRSRAGSARGGSTDGGSTRGSISVTAGAMTSRSASSGEDNYHDLEDECQRNNPFQAGERALSTVVFSFDRERSIIQDGEADPEWDQQQRHQKRFSRIRNRVPTGHPSLMRGPSDELQGVIHEYEKALSTINLDSRTAENTQANKNIQPAPSDDETVPVRTNAEGTRRNVTLVDNC